MFRRHACSIRLAVSLADLAACAVALSPGLPALNLIRLIVLIAAVVTVVLTSDDILSEKLIKDYTAKLNQPATINKAIQYGFNSIHDNLDSLRQDYPNFTPEVKHWSPHGSAYLHYLDIGEGLGKFSIRLPDQLIIVDSEGHPETHLSCGTETDVCEVIMPMTPELGVTGSFFYEDSQGNTTPAIDIAAYWGREGRVETLANCIWSFTPDASRQKLTVESVTNRALPYETKDLFGYYKVNVHFNTGDETGKAAGYRYAQIERLTKEQFLAYKACNYGAIQ